MTLSFHKLTQPTTGSTPESTGLGWYEQDAWEIYGGLFDALNTTNRFLEIIPPAQAEHLPNIEHEDRRIFGLFKQAVGKRPDSDPVLVTKDRKFARRVNENAAVLRSSGKPIWIAVGPALFPKLIHSYSS